MVAEPRTASPSTEHSDPEVGWMLRVQQDDPGALAMLWSHYWPRVFGKVLRQVGDRLDAEDITQEVFLRLYRSRKRYRPEAKLATWIFHIARNVVRNTLRSRRRKPLVAFAELTGTEAAPPEAIVGRGDQPDRPLERAELAGAVRDAIAGLHSRQRTAVELQCNECSYAEIASELAMSTKAAKSLLYRARNQLRESLAPLADAVL